MLCDGLIGALIVDPDRLDVVAPIVRPDHFCHEWQSIIYAAMLAMREEGLVCDYVSLIYYLDTHPNTRVDTAELALYVIEAATRCPSSQLAEQYARMLAELPPTLQPKARPGIRL